MPSRGITKRSHISVTLIYPINTPGMSTKVVDTSSSCSSMHTYANVEICTAQTVEHNPQRSTTSHSHPHLGGLVDWGGIAVVDLGVGFREGGTPFSKERLIRPWPLTVHIVLPSVPTPRPDLSLERSVESGKKRRLGRKGERESVGGRRREVRVVRCDHPCERW